MEIEYLFFLISYRYTFGYEKNIKRKDQGIRQWRSIIYLVRSFGFKLLKTLESQDHFLSWPGKPKRQNPPFPVLPYILPELGESALNNGEAS